MLYNHHLFFSFRTFEWDSDKYGIVNVDHENTNRFI